MIKIKKVFLHLGVIKYRCQNWKRSESSGLEYIKPINLITLPQSQPFKKLK